MILPRPPEPSGPPSSSELPADYRNPWLSLGDNLQAVAADTRLRLRELWRRNGDGSLQRPPWWPRDLAPLFWPLLLALLLSALVGVGFAASQLLRAPVSPSPSPSPPPSSPLLLPEQAPAPEPALEPSVAPPSDASSEPAAAPTEPLPSLAAESPLEEPPPAELAIEPQDPLEQLLQGPETEGLVSAAAALPDHVTLVLQVRAAFTTRPLSAQQQLAERWQQLAVDLGYGHLELRDSRAGLLARDALVGSGMIVLNEPAGP